MPYLNNNSMEYSVYCFHSNINTKIFNFIRYGKIINICGSYYTDVCEPEETFNFNISIEELKSCKKLYEYYILSILLTENIHLLSYHKREDIWCVYFKKNWKGLYFTEYYSGHGISILGVSPDKISHMIDEQQTKHFKDYIETRESEVCDYLSKYLETNLEKVIKKMENELFTIEKAVYTQKKQLLFSSKIKRFVNDDTMFHINKFLMV